MAFDHKYKEKESGICPICRRPVPEFRAASEPAYHSGSKMMCKACMKHFYRNRSAGRTAGITDDPKNLLVRLRPAQILEKPRLLRRAEPAGGYEFTVQNLCAQQIVQNVVIWALLCTLIMLLGDEGSRSHISMMLLDCFMAAFSAVWACRNLYLLIKGLLLGMGHTRRILLAGSAAVLVLIVLNTFPRYLF